MSKPSRSWTACCNTDSFGSCALLLLGVVALLYLALIPLALWLQGLDGLQQAATAAVISLLVGITVLAISHQSSLRKNPLVAMLLAMGLRMIPLLTIGLVVAFSRAPLTGKMGLTGERGEPLGFVCYLVLFYIATLAVETYVSVQLAQTLQLTQASLRAQTGQTPTTPVTLLPSREPQV